MILCYVENCDRPFSAKGLCEKHYYRLNSCGTTKDPNPLPKTCLVGGCGNKHKSQGLCYPHYKKTPAKQRLELSGYVKWEPPTECEVEGCGRSDTRLIKGLCTAHYQQIYKHGRILSYKISGKSSYAREGVPCDFELCDRGATSKGYCNAHYQQIISGKPLTVLRESWAVSCTVEGCDLKPKSRGMCAGHYSRWYSTGDPLPKPKTLFEDRIEDTQDLLSFGVTDREELAKRANWPSVASMIENLPEDLKERIRLAVYRD